jgi:GTP-binding protein
MLKPGSRVFLLVNMNKNIRNIAVVAHVDHGKTTLVDALLKQTNVFRENQEEMGMERILDSNDLEREKGITILAKNCSINYKGVKVNITDTPGHADFSGEIERTLSMSDGVLLIVDAQEGPMPQTRFVLKKALELDLKVIVVINKIDKKYARVNEVDKKIEELFLELATNDTQLDFPVLYAIGRDGVVFSEKPKNFKQKGDVTPLLKTIISFIPPPQGDENKPFKMFVTSFHYDSHIGKVAIGKISQGKIKKGDKIVTASNPKKEFKAEKIMVPQGLSMVEIDEAVAGDVAAIAGITDITIGETITDPSDTSSLGDLSISEPTMHITIGSNTSPLSGLEAEFSTSRQLFEYLTKELESNLSLKMEVLSSGKLKVSGRGELHLAILLETLRREGFELEVGKPEVILKIVEGRKLEPVEEVSIIVPNEFVGVISQELGKRYANLHKIEPINARETEFIYHIPTRATLGLKSLLLTQTKGTIIYSSQIIGHEPVGKALPKLRKGVLMSSQSGEVLTYGLSGAQKRGITFVSPNEKVYEGMIVGLNAKDDDISVNVCKGKKLTNMRSTSSDGIIHLTPPTILGIEQALDFLEADELLEITPLSLRLRKKHLTKIDKKKSKRLESQFMISSL